jgi:putative ABC transport system ATP-binding protein
MTDAIIEVRDLKKIYHVGDVEVHALRGVNLTVAASEFLWVPADPEKRRCSIFWAA